MIISHEGNELSILTHLKEMHEAHNADELERAYKRVLRDLESAHDIYRKAIEFNELYARFVGNLPTEEQ